MTVVNCDIFMFSWNLQPSAEVTINYELTKLVNQQIALIYAKNFMPIFFSAWNN